MKLVLYYGLLGRLRNKLTIKQKMLLEAIEWFINEYGYSPTNRELANILKQRRTKADTGDEKVEILIRDAFGTFKGEVPYYSARIMSIPKFEVPGLEELDEMYEEWIEGEDE